MDTRACPKFTVPPFHFAIADISYSDRALTDAGLTQN